VPNAISITSLAEAIRYVAAIGIELSDGCAHRPSSRSVAVAEIQRSATQLARLGDVSRTQAGIPTSCSRATPASGSSDNDQALG